MRYFQPGQLISQITLMQKNSNPPLLKQFLKIKITILKIVIIYKNLNQKVTKTLLLIKSHIKLSTRIKIL